MQQRRTDEDVPPPEACVLGPLLARHAREAPDKIFALFEDGVHWTYGETLSAVQAAAGGLQALGVRQGDYVNAWLPNGREALLVWFALNWLGAVYVPINLAYRGKLLEHVIANAGARLMVARSDLVERLSVIDRAQLSDILVVGDLPAAIAGVRLHPWGGLEGAPVAEHAAVMPWDVQMVIYTSGTTGPSKGVLMTYCHAFTSVDVAFGHFGSDDRCLVALPLFHIAGTGCVLLALYKGASFALVTQFSTGNFWAVVRETGTTCLVLLGVMAAFLAKEPPRADDRDHPLRSVMMVPYTEDAAIFESRFGCEVRTCFNMTEISSPIVAAPGGYLPASSCGKIRGGVEARLVDGHDIEVPEGEIGELILRCDRPWSMTIGYLNNPEATAAAWRNGWFHTGDAFRRDEDGNYFFVDRIKDAIRRRGENISSFEVESDVCCHEAVREAAAIGVPGEFGEEEVLVVVAPAPGARVDPAELVAFLEPRMATFMLPRYIRILDDLPKTPTQKVQKHLLRGDGVTHDTYDRLAGHRPVAVKAPAVAPTGAGD